MTGVSRRGRDRLVDAGRDDQPFTVHVTGRGGDESQLDARAVIDASGTWRQPNPAGADGLPALGERAAADLSATRSRTSLRRSRSPGAHRRGRQRPLGAHRDHRAGPDRAGQPGHPDHLGAAPRRRRRPSAAAPPTSCRSAARSASGPGRRSTPAWWLVTGFRIERIRRDVAGACPGGRGRPRLPPGGPRRRSDRLPARPVVPVRDAAGAGPDAAGAGADRRRDRPERSLLRHVRPRPARRTSRTPSPACTWSA